MGHDPCSHRQLSQLVGELKQRASGEIQNHQISFAQVRLAKVLLLNRHHIVEIEIDDIGPSLFHHSRLHVHPHAPRVVLLGRTDQDPSVTASQINDEIVGAGFAARIAAAERSGDDELQTGDLTPRRDFTDVRDVVRAYRLLATEGRPGVAYNICSGTSVSIGELAGLLLGLTDARMHLVEDPDLLRPVELPELRGDASLLRRHTGWAPSISLDETLSDVLEDWRLRLTEAQ